MSINIQNIPRKDTLIKRAFIPKFDVFVLADYSQIEYRLLAYYLSILGWESMVDVFKQGFDLHTETAQAIFNTSAPTEEQRQAGKTLNFAMIYGGGTPTVSRQLGVDKKQAKHLINEFHKRWPGIGQSVWAGGQSYYPDDTLNFHLAQKRAHRGYIRTLNGRELHTMSDHKNLNGLIQGSAADLIRQSVVKAHKRFCSWPTQPAPQIVNIVHDEIMVDSKIDDVFPVIDALREEMADERVQSRVPIEVDFKVVGRWGGEESDTKANNLALRIH